MQLSRLLLRALVPCLLIQVVLPQELPFEIPVQLIGFPIIILAVRLSNFLKKLSYAVNPSTYRSRTRRGSEHAVIDISDIEKKLINEMGEKVCVYEDICIEYAEKVNKNQNYVLDWQEIFRHYEKFPKGKKEFYLLSVFMGDIVKSKEVCSQLAKKGRSCNETSSRELLEENLKQNSTEITNTDKSSQFNLTEKLNRENKSFKQPQQYSKSKIFNNSSPQHQAQISHHRITSHEDSLNKQDGDSTPHQSDVQSREHVHTNENSKYQQTILFGQNPPHHNKYTSRIIES